MREIAEQSERRRKRSSGSGGRPVLSESPFFRFFSFLSASPSHRRQSSPKRAKEDEKAGHQAGPPRSRSPSFGSFRFFRLLVPTLPGLDRRASQFRSASAMEIFTSQSAVALKASRRTPRRPVRFGVRREDTTRPRVKRPRRFLGDTPTPIETSRPSPLRTLRVLRVSIAPYPASLSIPENAHTEDTEYTKGARNRRPCGRACPSWPPRLP
jgi:hypothetical protein